MSRSPKKTPRQSFDSAYSILEATVRNFSRDKLLYEDTINGLKRKVESCEQTICENNDGIQALLQENEKLEIIHEEDQTARWAVDAMLATVTSNQELLTKSTNDFECLEKQILERYVSIGELVDSLKMRQIQLFDWIGDLKLSLQEYSLKLSDSEKLCDETRVNAQQMLQEQTNQALSEKMEFQQNEMELQSKIQTLSSQNHELTDKLQFLEQQGDIATRVKTSLQETIAALQSEIESLISKSEENKDLLKDLEMKLSESTKTNAETTAEYEKAMEKNATLVLDQKMKFQEKISTMEAEIQSVASSKNELEQNIQSMKDKMDELGRQADAAEANHQHVLGQQAHLATREKMNLQENIVALQSEIDSLTSKMHEYEDNMKDLEQKLIESIKLNAETKAEYEKTVEGNSTLVLQQNMQFQQKLSTMEAEIESLASAKNELSQNLQSMKDEMDEVKRQEAEAKANHQHVLQEQANQSLSEKMNLQQKVMELQSDVESLSLEKNELTVHLQGLTHKINEMETVRAENNADYDRLLGQQADLATREKMSLQEKMTALQSEIDSLTSKTNEYKDNLKDLKNKLSESTKKNAETKAEYEKAMDGKSKLVLNQKMKFQQKFSTMEAEILSLASAKREMAQNLQSMNDKMDEMERKEVAAKANYQQVLEKQANQAMSEKIDLQQKVVGLQSDVESLTSQKNELTKHLEGLNDKMSESEKRKTRRSSLHMPSSMRRPNTASVPGILKRNSLEKNSKAVSFNNNVEIRNFTPIPLSSSDSDSDLLFLDCENRKEKMGNSDSVQPPKKQRMSEMNTGGASVMDNKPGTNAKEVSMDVDSSYSPRKFFKNRTSPLKPMNNCKSPGRSQSASQPH